jgi:predicted nucleic acid-binding protein
VVDASVWVSRLVLQDAFHQASRRWLDEYTAGGGVLVVPVLLLPEVAGAIARRTGDPRLGRRAVDGLLRLPVLRVVPLDRHLGEESARLAADLSLRGADAVYVGVARQLGIPLVTWDQEQQGRAGGVITVRTPEIDDPQSA